METIITIAAILISLAVGIVLGMIIRKKIAESKIEGAEQEAKRVLEQAKIEAENLKKEEINVEEKKSLKEFFSSKIFFEEFIGNYINKYNK